MNSRLAGRAGQTKLQVFLFPLAIAALAVSLMLCIARGRVVYLPLSPLFSSLVLFASLLSLSCSVPGVIYLSASNAVVWLEPA